MGEVDRVISWRYHVVSIVAVVLAFGLGLLAGTSVVGDDFVRGLQDDFDQAQRQRDEARALVAIYDRFTEAVQPLLRDDVLAGVAAVVVTMEGVERPARRTVDELTAAGAEVVATIELTSRLTETDLEGNAQILEEILGVTGMDPDTLRERVADELAVRLAVGSGVADEDLLGRLLADGLVTADRDLDADALVDVGGSGQIVVVSGGGPAPAGLPGPDALLVPLAAGLVRLNAAGVAVGPSDDPYGFVRAVREATDIPDCSLVTVDDIDLPIGGIALAMGIDRFLEDADPTIRPGGDYGLEGHGIVPGVEEVPSSCLR